RKDRAHYGRRGKAQPLAKHLRLEQKCARRTLTINRTGFRSKSGQRSDLKPDSIPINYRTVFPS
ncbi:hypothetical protein, partial [Sinorhizobium meliloti]|uniref:hypothetical protein n=1 Tax=Rhizobium meliloti TaxID=382 RepID=UPI001AEC8DD8